MSCGLQLGLGAEAVGAVVKVPVLVGIPWGPVVTVAAGDSHSLALGQVGAHPLRKGAVGVSTWLRGSGL